MTKRQGKQKKASPRAQGGGAKIAVITLSALAVALLAVFLVLVLRPSAVSADEKLPYAERTEAIDPSLSFLQEHPEYEGTLLLKTEDAGQKYLDDTLFIGDSNTLRLSLFNLMPLSNVMGIEGIGVQSVTAHPGIYWSGVDNPTTIIRGVEIVQPRRIISCFGTNNLLNRDPEWFAECYAEMLDALEEAYPYAEIIIASVPPLGENVEAHLRSIKPELVIEYNQALMDLAKERGLRFLNTYEVLSTKLGYLKPDCVISDGVHLSEQALKTILTYVRTHATDTEDARPEIPKNVPGRRPAPYIPPKEEEDTPFSVDAAAAYVAQYLSADGFTFKTGSKIDYSTAIDSMSFSYALDSVKAGQESEVAQAVYQSVRASYSSGNIIVGGMAYEDKYVISVYFFASGETPPDPQPPALNKDSLAAAISSAQSLLASAPAEADGSTVPVGQYYVPVGATAALQSALSSAQSVHGSATTQAELDSADGSLRAAISAFGPFEGTYVETPPDDGGGGGGETP